MATEPQRIDFADFTGNIHHIFDELRTHNQPVLVERDDETYRIEKQDIWQGYDAAKVRRGIRETAGVLSGVDRDRLLLDVYEQREQGPGRVE
ncbi:MAG: hypothetical protein ACRDFX_00785 [Chloroflexota bacterium]